MWEGTYRVYLLKDLTWFSSRGRRATGRCWVRKRHGHASLLKPFLWQQKKNEQEEAKPEGQDFCHFKDKCRENKIQWQSNQRACFQGAREKHDCKCVGQEEGRPGNASKFLNPRGMEHKSRGTEPSPRGAHRGLPTMGTQLLGWHHRPPHSGVAVS